MTGKRVTQREVNAAAATLQSMQRQYGEHNMATERAWSTWFELNEQMNAQRAAYKRGYADRETGHEKDAPLQAGERQAYLAGYRAASKVVQARVLAAVHAAWRW